MYVPSHKQYESSIAALEIVLLAKIMPEELRTEFSATCSGIEANMEGFT